MGWFHNAKLKRRADEAFDEGDEIRFDMGDLKNVPIEELHHRIARLLRDYFSIKTECSIENDRFALGRIYAGAAEYAARLHSGGATRQRVQLMFLTADRTGPKHMDVMLVYGGPDA